MTNPAAVTDWIIGIIGLGEMGCMYASRLSDAGWKVYGADVPEKYATMVEKFAGTRVKILKNGHLVSRAADYIIYNVEAANIERVVKEYGPSTKLGAVVGGQTSCKCPEVQCFEKYLPEDVEIVTIHSMHSAQVNSKGQPLIVIQHRASDRTREMVEQILSCFQSRIVRLTARQHDEITADTQAVTHMAFLTMGSAWKRTDQYPWAISRLTGGLENAKINIAMRIFSNQWHVYAGLAIFNPTAHKQVLQYAKSVKELFTLMITSREEELRQRLFEARDYVFAKVLENQQHSLLLPDELLGKYSLSKDTAESVRKPNSHLSVLGIVDCWHQLKIIPYDHMICSTPLFRILLGVTEFLFMTPGLLEKSISDAVNHTLYRRDDLEFVMISGEWSQIIKNGDFEGYKRIFVETQKYFEHMFPEATKIGNDMVREINEHYSKQKI